MVVFLEFGFLFPMIYRQYKIWQELKIEITSLRIYGPRQMVYQYPGPILHVSQAKPYTYGGKWH